jgi:transposase
MFALTEQHRYFIYNGVADMRKGFDGLCGIVESELLANPMDGSVYLFINRRRDRIKLLLWTEGGFVLYYKLLEKGTYEIPAFDNVGSKQAMTWETLVLMIRGIQLSKIKRKVRYLMH